MDLASFECSSRSGLSDKLQLNFSKQQFLLYGKIVEKARQQTGHRGPTNQNALAIDANVLDAERKGMTVPQFLKYLKDHDPNKKTWQKWQCIN